MLNRIVSISSLLVALLSAVMFFAAGYWVMTGSIGQIEGIYSMAGWLLSAALFAYRWSDPAWLEPSSIIKAH